MLPICNQLVSPIKNDKSTYEKVLESIKGEHNNAFQSVYGNLIICLHIVHTGIKQVGRFNSYRDERASCRLSVPHEIITQFRIIFLGKDRSLKRFYGKLILAVSDRARSLLAMICCDPTELVTLTDNDGYHLL